MPKILMVRHGRAAASCTDDLDPGLTPQGHGQAERVTIQLTNHLPLKVISSPLKRALETAEPMLGIVGGELSTEPRVSEIPSPGLSLDQRGHWLQTVMAGVWSEQTPELLGWRQELIDCLLAQSEDCVIFSHFVAINTAVGFAGGIDSLAVSRPQYASIIEFQTDGTTLHLISKGNSAITKVN